MCPNCGNEDTSIFEQDSVHGAASYRHCSDCDAHWGDGFAEPFQIGWDPGV